jgi:hypothetical protein
MKHHTSTLSQPEDTLRDDDDLEPSPDEEPLTREQLRELRRRIKEMDDPVRYMVVSRLLPRWKLWFDVSDGNYCSDIESGTLFKRREYAEAVRSALAEGRKSRDLLVAKVTTRGGKIRVLRYFGLDPNASAGAR